MKRTVSLAIILIMIMLILVGCGAINGGGNSPAAKNVLSQLNTMKDQGSKPKEMFDYINQNIKDLDQKAASEAVGILITTLEAFETTYNDQLFTGNNPDLMFQYFEYQFDYSKIESIKEEELKTLLYDVTLGGFKITEVEGTFEIVVDYEALRTFNEYVNDEIKAYIDIMDLRYSRPVAIDASLTVSLEELEKRILQMENYILSYDKTEREEIMISMYEGHMMVYMSGMDNSPVFDYETGAVLPEMLQIFESSESKNKDTVFGKVLNKYIALLKQEGLVNSEKVQDFVLNIDSLVNDQLENAKNK